MVVVRTFNTRYEAEIAKSYLEAQGIESFVQADDLGGIQPPFTNVPGVNLLVKSEEYEEAKGLLDLK